MCVYFGFTSVLPRVLQKVVMGRWVQGQTRGPVEVKTMLACGRQPEE